MRKFLIKRIVEGTGGGGGYRGDWFNLFDVLGYCLGLREIFPSKRVHWNLDYPSINLNSLLSEEHSCSSLYLKYIQSMPFDHSLHNV